MDIEMEEWLCCEYCGLEEDSLAEEDLLLREIKDCGHYVCEYVIYVYTNL